MTDARDRGFGSSEPGDEDPRDADLRDALGPLAGDPAAAWARVMAELPASRPGWRSPWPVVAAAAAAGLLVGWLASRVLAPAAEPGPEPNEVPVAQAEPAPGARVVGTSGALFVETDTGPRQLALGDPVGFEQFVQTAPEGRGFLRLPGDVELRLAKGTQLLLLGGRSLELARGQVFVQIPGSAGAVSLTTVEGEVLARADGTVQVTALPGRTTVVALKGAAQVTDASGEPLQLAAGRLVECTDGVHGPVETVELPFEHVAWQIDMLAGCPDREEEAFSWTWTLIDALDRPELAARAELALRRTGSLGAMVAGMAAAELPDNRAALRKRCWLLATQLADAGSVRYLLGGVRADDDDIRVASVRAVERITGIASERDLEFWRSAAPAERFDVLRRWEDRLRKF